MAFLVLLIIATAVIFAWLLVSLTRFTLGDLRLPRLHPSPVQPVNPPPPKEGRAEPPAIVVAPEPVTAAPRPDPELEAELAVREHLYGRHSRRS